VGPSESQLPQTGGAESHALVRESDAAEKDCVLCGQPVAPTERLSVRSVAVHRGCAAYRWHRMSLPELG